MSLYCARGVALFNDATLIKVNGVAAHTIALSVRYHEKIGHKMSSKRMALVVDVLMVRE